MYRWYPEIVCSSPKHVPNRQRLLCRKQHSRRPITVDLRQQHPQRDLPVRIVLRAMIVDVIIEITEIRGRTDVPQAVSSRTRTDVTITADPRVTDLRATEMVALTTEAADPVRITVKDVRAVLPAKALAVTDVITTAELRVVREVSVTTSRVRQHLLPKPQARMWRRSVRKIRDVSVRKR